MARREGVIVRVRARRRRVRARTKVTVMEYGNGGSEEEEGEVMRGERAADGARSDSEFEVSEAEGEGQ